MPKSRPTVLILSTHPAFARDVAAHWAASANSPEFTVLDEGVFRDFGGGGYDLAIVDAASPKSLAQLKQTLVAAGKPAIIVHADQDRISSPLPFSQSEGSIIELYAGKGQEGSSGSRAWAETAGLLGREILRRTSAEEHQRQAELACASLAGEATLGRYMVEMRHSVCNALTGVLGNAELLTLEPGLPAGVLEQADTIRNMALRLHEIFQRFSSIEKELTVAARETGKAQIRHAATGGR